MTWRIGAAAGLVFVCGLASGEAFAQSPKITSGVAAYYSKDYQGTTASGEHYDPNKFTAAHRTLPFGTRVLVTDPRPFNKGRMIDLSLAAAKELHMTGRGLMKVTVVVQ